MAKSKEGGATYRITDLQEDERPRERLEQLGAGALSTAELLAILLRVGIEGENAVHMAQRLLNEMGGLSGIQRASFHDVCQRKGLGPAKAAQIKAAIEIGSRLRSQAADEKPAVHSPADAAEYVRYEMCALDHEELWVMLLDVRNHILQVEKLYRGSLTASTVRVGEIFRAAIARNSANIIIFHNHPSGDPTPSPEDIALTRAISQAGTLLDIDVLDHVVIGQGRFVSLKERGLGFVPKNR